ncbi:MAG: YceD family protein [Bacilli bacterium]|nr:YceD family protein [Bacilli bacterium]MDD3422249.1 YceD family protein [Bacilli bacterium]MDD4065558.1 YceD family protein [Bacilli bacterium]
MKWTLAWLKENAHPEFVFDEALVYDPALIKKTPNLLDLKDVRVKGQGTFDEVTSKVHLKFVVTGTMIVPCAVTLEATPYPFAVDYDEKYSFIETQDKDCEFVKGNELDICALVYELIVVSIPLKVVKQGAKYPASKKGNWEVITEDELANRKKDEIDPRLAKLKDYFK